MPGRLSTLFSRNEEKQSTSEQSKSQQDSVTADLKKDTIATPTLSSCHSADHSPPTYRPNDDSVDPEHALPPPDLTAGFSNLKINANSDCRLPTSKECIAHLKLLECFSRLQQTIGATDGLFGIHDDLVHSLHFTDAEAAKLLARLAEKRWAVYITRAVDRFEAWHQTTYRTTGYTTMTTIIRQGSMGRLTEPSTFDIKPKPFDVTNLPPIDVLLVWHAYRLNPRVYFEDCLRKGRMESWFQAFPWEAIAAAIDSETFCYKPKEETVNSFVANIGRNWDNLEDNTEKLFQCTVCNSNTSAEWTIIQPSAVDLGANTTVTDQLDDILMTGQGYCDKNFEAACESCGAMMNIERLKTGKFIRDVALLMDHTIPLPGTLFGTNGIVCRMHIKEAANTATILRNTNNLFTLGLGHELLGSPFKSSANATMSDVRDRLDVRIKDKSYMRKVRSSASAKQDREERIAVRRMMSRYWDNPSDAGLDLVSAVVRQCGFTEKMHNIDWLHSPALPSTMGRLIKKYQRFMDILYVSAGTMNMAVPTLDVDLAWHTHQLNPLSYCFFTIELTGQFVDHDDKIPELTLNNSFAWTSKQYQTRYGEPYSECTCWYCEAVRESHTSSVGRFFGSNNSTAGDKLHHAEQDPLKSVHISTHNAVQPTGDIHYDAALALQAGKLNEAYNEACNRAKKKGRTPPKKDDYYYSSAYGYPVYLPAYVPAYGALAYTSCLYPVAPGCMAFTAGSAGNCCTGTCAAGAAAGAAAGGCASMGGGCAGGSAGGCGGGSGGGCGGGGGGGCGGGGGGGC